MYNYVVSSLMEHCGDTHLSHKEQFDYGQLSQMIRNVYKDIKVEDKSELKVYIEVLDLLCERYGFIRTPIESSFMIRNRTEIEIAGLQETSE